MKEIGWKEAGESRGFPITWMGIIEDSSRWKKRNAKSGKIENVKKKIQARARKML